MEASTSAITPTGLCVQWLPLIYAGLVRRTSVREAAPGSSFGNPSSVHIAVQFQVGQREVVGPLLAGCGAQQQQTEHPVRCLRC